MKRTFKQSQDLFYGVLLALGWRVSSPYLKIRWAESQGVRLWFKPQAIYIGESGGRLGNARSATYDFINDRHIDLRSLPVDQFELWALALVDRGVA
jgi:hypothetical protein